MIDPKPKNKVVIQSGSRTQPTGKIVAATSADVNYTPRNAEYREKIKTSGFMGSETEGVKVDKSGNTTVKPFSRKVVRSPGGYTRIYGDDGTLIKEGAGDTKDMQDAVKKSQKDVEITNSQRENTKRVNDLFGQKATNITDKEVSDLNRDKHATGNPTDAKIIEATAKETERKNLTEKNKPKIIKVKVQKK
jgi:hypothetical protein